MKTRAFTLLELAVATAIFGVLALVLVPSVADQIDTLRRTAEDQRLDQLVLLVERSFRDEQEARNVSSFSTHRLGAGGADTLFDDAVSRSEAPRNGDWFVKLALLEGIRVDAESTTLAQPALWHLAWNETEQPRWLFVGPEELGQQRYLLVSLVAPSSQGLVVPLNDGTAGWFDAIWNHHWEGRAAPLPADWLSRLTAAEVAAWQEGRGQSTRVGQLRVRRIVQPKHRLIVNNTHTLYSTWVDYEGVRGRLVSAPASGVLTSPEILAGRLIVVRRGTSDPGAEACRFYLHEPTSITVQP